MINKADLSGSIKMLKQDQNMHGGQQKEESVEELMAKLAKKGKKVKLLDESASVKELPKQEDLQDGSPDRDEQDIPINDDQSPSKN